MGKPDILQLPVGLLNFRSYFIPFPARCQFRSPVHSVNWYSRCVLLYVAIPLSLSLSFQYLCLHQNSAVHPNTGHEVSEGP